MMNCLHVLAGDALAPFSDFPVSLKGINEERNDSLLDEVCAFEDHMYSITSLHQPTTIPLHDRPPTFEINRLH